MCAIDAFYGVNTRWVCLTCNRAKGRTPPELWGAKLICWQQWHSHQGKTSPLSGLPLFEQVPLDEYGLLGEQP
jgi:hypothetical protein